MLSERKDPLVQQQTAVRRQLHGQPAASLQKSGSAGTSPRARSASFAQGTATGVRFFEPPVAAAAAEASGIDGRGAVEQARKQAVWPQLGSEQKLPSQRQAQRIYKYLLPVSAGLLVAVLGPSMRLLLASDSQGGKRGFGGQLSPIVVALAAVPTSVSIAGLALSMLSTVVTYYYHWSRFSNFEDAPDAELSGLLGPTPSLVHVVVVCTYREPIGVLERTFESIAAQRGLHTAPIAVLAAEARDTTRQSSFAHLQAKYQDRFGELLMTEHQLEEGELAGKASNENFAVREIYRRLVEEGGLDPFEVIITIADADSLFSDMYLARVAEAYCSEPDGRRLIYKGPLNVYRNFADAGLLVQSLELARCHADAFHGLFTVPYPYSNYSLALGFASELGFWTPDVMPEDIHTQNKAMVNSFGSRTTVMVNAVICNDLVPSIADRYGQAKRHQWGSVTELAWIVALWTETEIRFPAWWAVFSAESARAGSLPGALISVMANVVQGMLAACVLLTNQDIPANARFLLIAVGINMLWSLLCFWVVELCYWGTVMRQFPVERPSACRWVLLILASPFVSTINTVLFFIVPTLHALCHASFVGHELQYVCAPKGDAAREQSNWGRCACVAC